jgi:hypothetical protein
LDVVLGMATSLIGQNKHVLAAGTEIKVRTDTPIPLKPTRNASFSASVSDDVRDKGGEVVISRAGHAHSSWPFPLPTVKTPAWIFGQ